MNGRRLTLVILALALVPAQGALAATTTVSITSTGFSPRTVSIVAGDRIVWRNTDSRNHQVVAASGAFASPVIRPGGAWAFTFQEAGNYGYRDALFPRRTGTIRVAGPPPAVALGVSQPQIEYGTAVTLSGQVNNKRPGEQVTLTAQPWGQPSPIVLATVVTGTEGRFAYVTKPQILTSYRATWKSVASIPITTAVAPVISLGRQSGWVTRVWAGRSMSARTVQVQRLSRFGQWVTLKQVTLGPGSRARFRLTLPKGVSRLRVAMSVNQAGAGYLAGFSKVVSWRQR